MPSSIAPPEHDIDRACDPSTLETSEALAQIEARLEEARVALATTGADCTRICAAAAGICEASRELCQLTGDASSRCLRARSACEEATRRRTHACPVCPTP
jgi:hypothetical protein